MLIILLFFLLIDKAKMEWSNVIRKSQFDDNGDNYISYGLMNVGSEVHVLFNILEKRNWLLTDQSFSPEGQLFRKLLIKISIRDMILCQGRQNK